MRQRILFLVPYPLDESPSQRFRFEQYFKLLEQKGYTWSIQSFLNADNWKIFFKRGNVIAKAFALGGGFMKRILILFRAASCSFVFIHREATPVGPPVIEWLIARVLRKKIIYDFDDAIWLTDRPNESLILRVVKWRSKVKTICSISYKVSCGNAYLADYASTFNPSVIYNPTTLDTDRWVPVPKVDGNNDSLVIGWTGSHSTLKYLEAIEPVLARIEQDFPHVRFQVIADKIPALPLKNLKFIPWAKKTETLDLSNFDIGIMPLPDDEWSKGKCGFKALQYMAFGIPSVASPVGINTRIIKDAVNGFLCKTDDEWNTALRKLILDPDLRKSMGKYGRETVVNQYSVSSNSSNFLSLFE